eukprot:CAMPEP_0115885534 /NCGR_PEP_ID=MMETSP0287-20121206/30727_1 /TAXON_ID=412157 /ORGANISM="Chrysochromulina rotalis, Strain UIO044" /LENGTH=139 /DNA_ID=CAMNT_0003341961 /DNA_START=167 /DNA_END=586 /DNA_ORIENTATION=-
MHLLQRWISPVGRVDNPRTPFSSLGALPWQTPDKEVASSARMVPYRCYPYFHALKNAFNQQKLARLAQEVSFEMSLSRQPICYIYGLEKNTFFHLEAFLTALRATPGCAVHAVPNAGHWVYKHKPEFCNDTVAKFILGR